MRVRNDDLEAQDGAVPHVALDVDKVPQARSPSAKRFKKCGSNWCSGAKPVEDARGVHDGRQLIDRGVDTRCRFPRLSLREVHRINELQANLHNSQICKRAEEPKLSSRRTTLSQNGHGYLLYARAMALILCSAPAPVAGTCRPPWPYCAWAPDPPVMWLYIHTGLPATPDGPTAADHEHQKSKS